MKTSKKLLSFFLAIVMIITSCSVGFTAFAQDNSNSIWSQDASAEASFDALNGLADDLLPSLLMGIGAINKPIYEKYAKAMGKTADELTQADKDDINSQVTIPEILKVLQPVLLNALGKKQSDYPGVIGSSKPSSYYDYLQRDSAISYYALFHYCKNYKDDNNLSAETRATLAEWYNYLLPISNVTLVDKTDETIKAVADNFETMADADSYRGAYLADLEAFFTEEYMQNNVSADDQAIIADAIKSANEELAQYSPDFQISTFAELLYYCYGSGQDFKMAYALYDAIHSTGTKVTFVGEADFLGMGEDLPFELTNDLTPDTYVDEIITSVWAIISDVTVEELLQEMTVDEIYAAFAEGEIGDASYGPLLRAMFRENMLPNYINVILESYYEQLTAGLAIKYADGINSYNDFKAIVDSYMPTVDAEQIFTEDYINELALIAKMHNNNYTMASYFQTGKYTYNHPIVNEVNATLPATIKGTKLADYLAMVTPFTNAYTSEKTKEYQQKFFTALHSNIYDNSYPFYIREDGTTVSASALTLDDTDKFQLSPVTNNPVVNYTGASYSLDTLKTFVDDARLYACSVALNSLIGCSFATDPETALKTRVDYKSYIDSKVVKNTPKVVLNEEQKAILNTEFDLTGELGTELLNYKLNDTVVGIVGNDIVSNILSSILGGDVDLVAALENIWTRIVDSPVKTIAELIPVLVMAIDSLVVPLVVNGESDNSYNLIWNIFDIVEKALHALGLPVLTADNGSFIGINQIGWDLNKMLPLLMDWLYNGNDAKNLTYYDGHTATLMAYNYSGDSIEKVYTPSDIASANFKYYTVIDRAGNVITPNYNDAGDIVNYTYRGQVVTPDELKADYSSVQFICKITYEDTVPYITGVYIADKALRGAEVKGLPRALAKATKNDKLGNILGEVIAELGIVFKEAVDEFVASDRVNQSKYLFDKDGNPKVNKNTGLPITVGSGLNNLFVAIPQLLDLMEDLAAEKYGISKDKWTFTYDGKLTEKEFEYEGVTYTNYSNTVVDTLKSYANSNDPNRSIGILDSIANLLVKDWINAIISLVNNVVEPGNEISNRLPIVAGLLNALGGFGEDSIITDILNGVFQIEREDEFSFSFEKQDNGLFGLSEKNAYFLLSNIDTLIEVITGLVGNIKGGASINGKALVGNTRNAAPTPTIKNAKANSKTYTDAELSNASDLINNLDKLVSSLLSDSTLNGFSLDSTSNILAGVVTFFTNYLGNDCYTELARLLNDYTFYITGSETHTPDADKNVDAKKVYTNESLTALMVETFLLIENVVENLFSDFSTTHKVAGGEAQYNLIVEAIEGLISPDAICVRLDGYEKVANELTKFNCWHNAASKTTRGNYKINLDWGITAGDKDAFFDAFAASLRLVTSILGVILVDTGWYETVVMPILNAVCKPNGIKIDTAAQFAKLTNGYHDEVLLGLMKPLGSFIDKFLSAPVTTLIKSVQGVAGILDDKTTPNIASIVKGGVTPISNELLGLADIFAISNDTLFETSLTLKAVLEDLAGKIGKYSDASNITIRNYKLCGQNLIPIVNKLLADTGIALKQISWSKLAKAKTPAAALVYVLDYLIETILDNDNLTALAKLINNDIVTMVIEALKAGKITSSDILSLVNQVLEVTDSPTLVYWTFAQYLQEITEKFAYPKGVTKAMADAGVTQLDSAIGSVLQLLGSLGVDLGATDLQGIISKNLFKNSLLTTIATALYGALDGLDPTIKSALKGLGIVTSTKDVAKILTNKSYGKTFSAAAEKIKAQDSWSDVANLNWGFKDGSAKAQQGFVNALVAILRPVSDIIAVFLNEGSLELNNVVYDLIMSINVPTTTKELKISSGDVPITTQIKYSLKNGVFTLKAREIKSNREHSRTSELKLDLRSLKNTLSDVKIVGTNGYNSAIIPLLEALGCGNIKTYKQYQSDAAKAKDNILLDVLNPLIGDNSASFLNKLCANPVSELTKLLPNIAMYLDAHGLSQLISNLLAPVTEIVYSTAKTLKLNTLIEDLLGMPVGDLVGGLLGLEPGKLNIDLTDLTTLNIEDIIIPVVNMVLAGLKNTPLSQLQLAEIDWNALISLGTKGTYQSKATGADGKFLTGKIVKNVDQGKVLIAVLRYVANLLTDNAKMLKNLICGIDAVAKNDLIKSIVQSVFNTIGAASPDQLVAAVFYLLAGEPTSAFWDYSAYKTGNYSFSYPEGMDTTFLKNLPPMLDGLIAGLIDLNETISKALYKDEIVSKLATALYGAIEGVKVGEGNLTSLLAQTDIDFSTENVANLLTDSRYGKSFDSAASVIRSAGSWKSINADQLKWGVTDRDSFMHALVAVLRPIYGVLDVLLNSASLGIFNIVRIPGSNGYTAAIVPLLEAFSCYNIKTQYQYRQDINKEYDAILLDIINPLWDKVEDILAAPLQTVASMIPNLGLFIGNDGLCQIIDNLLNPVSALLDAIRPVVDLNDLLNVLLPALNVDLDSLLGKVGITNFNLDLYDLNKTLKPILGGDSIINLVNNILGLIKIKGTPLGIKLNPVDWLQLASHGKTIVSASQAATYGARIFVEGDSSETLIAVLRYLIVTINTGSNYDNIGSLIGGLIGGADDTISNVVNQVLDVLKGDTDDVIKELVGLLEVLGS